MKKLINFLLIQLCLIGFIFAAPINSKNGYKELSWGSSVDEAKKAGYKLSVMDDKEYLGKLYNVDVDAYNVISKDKSVRVLQFHYFGGKLFAVTELLDLTELNPQKLEKRYGNFNEQGIYLVGSQYMDAKLDVNGAVSNLSIVISNIKENISTIMYDWNVYKDISFVGKKLSKTEEKTIIDELGPLANKLVQEKSGAKKPSFAFMALTTDYKNTLVDNYVTDALTEAMFNTGKIKIIERANLEAILSEQKFQSSGLVNEETVKSIGMIAGVDFVCYGNLKDLGDSLTVNARVVDVETGELCAISRATITKDDYLLNQSKAAVGVTNSITKNSSSTKTTSAPEVKKTTTPTQNNAWKVVQYRKDSEGYTQYIFRVFSTDERFVFVSYKKCDVAANSRVIAGIYWGTSESSHYESRYGTYDIKTSEGTVSKEYNDLWREYLDAYEKDSFKFVWNQKEGSRFLTERFLNNETVTLRHKNLVRKFQTSGMLDKMAEYGITWEEIDAAIASEEF
mgnify:CR=1 FL=1